MVTKKMNARIIKKSNGIRAYKPNYQISRLLWIFHQCDDDPFPSVPHGDSLNASQKLKLDIFTGRVYFANNHTFYRTANKKDMERLRQDKRMRKLILDAHAYYSTFHPEIPLERVPWLDTQYVNRKVSHIDKALVFVVGIEK